MPPNPDKATEPSRRKILQAAGAATVIAGAPAIISSAAPSEKLGLGLIGCGGRGTGAAFNALAADDNVQLTAVGDLFEDQIENSIAQLQKRYPDRINLAGANARPTGFDAFEKVTNHPDVDLVILATPPAFRPAHLAAAVAAGKHAFIEITAAVDAPGVRSVIDSAQRADDKGLALVSGFCWRYDATLRAARDQIAAGAIGDVRATYGTYYRANLGKKIKGKRPPNTTDLEWQIRDWYSHLWLSGDVTLLLSGGHSVDKMSWWMNDEMPLAAVATGGQTFGNWGNTFDHTFVVYEYAGGRRGFLGCRSHSGCHNENGDHVIGSKGILRFTGRSPEIEGETNWRYRGPVGNKYQTEHDEWIRGIRDGKPINDGRRMAETTLMTLMGRMAAYTGQRVTWEAALNSQQQLVPDKLDRDSKVEDIPLAVPGDSEFV
jgi:predicted dehydrogenase